jgi:HSP20 family protein
VYGPFGGTGFEDIVRGLLKPLRETRDAAPIKVDVVEKADAFVVRAEVPGVTKEDIQVTIEGDQLTIAAEIKREGEQKDGERVLRSERYYGKVYRSFVLPVEIDENASQAKYDGGVLELILAKKPAAAGKKLTIN